MFIAYLIVTVVTAAANVFSATLDFIRYKQISINMARVGVPESWMPLLGILKAAAAVGLLVGIGVPFVGASAALGLVCFFVGTFVTHLRARDYSFGLAVVFLALAVATLVLTLHARAPVAFAGVHTRIPHTHRDDSPRTHIERPRRGVLTGVMSSTLKTTLVWESGVSAVNSSRLRLKSSLRLQSILSGRRRYESLFVGW